MIMGANAKRGRIILLGFYISGIIIGGGILALPFVARDLGLPFLLLLLVLFGVLFHRIYLRIIDSVGYALCDVAKVRPGLSIYDYSMSISNVGRFGRLAFTVGLLLYIVPANIVYILYGMKSIIDLSELLNVEADEILLLVGIIITTTTILITWHLVKHKKYYLTLHDSFLIKFILMLSIWLASVGALGFVSGRDSKIILSVTLYALALIVAEFFPEKVLKAYHDIYDIDDLIPKHKVLSYLTMVKILLILLIPMIGFVLIVSRIGPTETIPLVPSNMSSVVYSITIVVFMYVGSGVYNILIYKWITKRLESGRKSVLIATILSILTYIAFTVLIIMSVRPNILHASDLNREHSFISLSKQLRIIGLSSIGLITIIVANVFSLVSVAIAYMGFTETLSERIHLDTKINQNLAWILITIPITIITVALEIFDVTRFATDALGIAGNAGGGLFILIIPWLLRDKKNESRIKIAICFLTFITFLNIFLAINSSTIITRITAIIATILVIIFGSATIYEAYKARRKSKK